MIHHQKGKKLNFMIEYVRLRKIKPVQNCGRLNTVMLSQVKLTGTIHPSSINVKIGKYLFIFKIYKFA